MCLTLKGRNNHSVFNGTAHVHMHMLMCLRGLAFWKCVTYLRTEKYFSLDKSI